MREHAWANWNVAQHYAGGACTNATTASHHCGQGRMFCAPCASLKMFFFRSIIFRRPPSSQVPTSPAADGSKGVGNCQTRKQQHALGATSAAESFVDIAAHVHAAQCHAHASTNTSEMRQLDPHRCAASRPRPAPPASARRPYSSPGRWTAPAHRSAPAGRAMSPLSMYQSRLLPYWRVLLVHVLDMDSSSVWTLCRMGRAATREQQPPRHGDAVCQCGCSSSPGCPPA